MVDALADFRIVSSAERIAILRDDVLLDLVAVPHLGDIPYIDHGAVYLADWEIIQFLQHKGLLFRRTLYSRSPIFSVPPGRMTFCALRAVLTSAGERPFAKSFLGSISTMIWRALPP